MLPEPFEEVRHYWRTRDLPMLLSDMTAKATQRQALDDLVAESERLGLYDRRWSTEDEG
jgi:hypothetical protein